MGLAVDQMGRTRMGTVIFGRPIVVLRVLLSLGDRALLFVGSPFVFESVLVGLVHEPKDFVRKLEGRMVLDLCTIG